MGSIHKKIEVKNFVTLPLLRSIVKLCYEELIHKDHTAKKLAIYLVKFCHCAVQVGWSVEFVVDRTEQGK